MAKGISNIGTAFRSGQQVGANIEAQAAQFAMQSSSLQLKRTLAQDRRDQFEDQKRQAKAQVQTGLINDLFATTNMPQGRARKARIEAVKRKSQANGDVLSLETIAVFEDDALKDEVAQSLNNWRQLTPEQQADAAPRIIEAMGRDNFFDFLKQQNATMSERAKGQLKVGETQQLEDIRVESEKELITARGEQVRVTQKERLSAARADEMTKFVERQQAAQIKQAEALQGESRELSLKVIQDSRFKDYSSVRIAARDILKALDDPSAFGDTSILFDTIRLLDPGSVVRASEAAEFRRAGNIFQKVVLLILIRVVICLGRILRFLKEVQERMIEKFELLPSNLKNLRVVLI